MHAKSTIIHLIHINTKAAVNNEFFASKLETFNVNPDRNSCVRLLLLLL